MANPMGVTLLLIILVNCFSDRKAHCYKYNSVGFTKVEIRRCTCLVIGLSKMNCHYPLPVLSDTQQEAVKRCLCCKAKKKDRTPKRKQFCDSVRCYTPAGPL